MSRNANKLNFYIPVALILLFSPFFLVKQLLAGGNEWHYCAHHKNSLLNRESNSRLASDTRSDSADIIHTAIHLRITDFNAKVISGFADLTFRPRVAQLPYLDLDLLMLSVDSILIGSDHQSFSYNDTLIRIQLNPPAMLGDTLTVRVYYGGVPQIDANGTGWGGFYFTNQYAYNMGVGFEADPHNYGRVWFPCFDNFVERSLFDYYITTQPNHKAYCGGLLTDSTVNADNTLTWHWKMNQTIPTYLASVAVSDYVEVTYNYQGRLKTFPVTLAARAVDTTNLKNSFLNLNLAIEAFEENYASYKWDRVGYVLVPFNGGAMEHAENIAYPRFAANGNLNYETLMAHELAHSWWGNLATCSSAKDMWLNEGWARFSEHLFLKKVYGQERYMDEVRNNHRNVLQYAEARDGGNYALDDIPHHITYGYHVYNKGAAVAHTLFNIFHIGIWRYFERNTFKSASTYNFFNSLDDVHQWDLVHDPYDYYHTLIQEPGHPHFEIDSFSNTQAGDKWQTRIHFRQKLRNRNNFSDDISIEFMAMGTNGEQKLFWVKSWNICHFVDAVFPFEPVYVAIDPNEKFVDATTDQLVFIDTPGIWNFPFASLDLEVTQASDSTVFRVIHNWVAPDPMVNPPFPGLHLSKERYWTLEGIWQPDFKANGTFTFNGQNSFNGGYLDNELITNSEDSLVMMYRINSGEDWEILDSFTIQTLGNANDKRGRIFVPDLKPGQYALAIFDHSRPYEPTVLPDYQCSGALVVSTEKEWPITGGYGFELFPNPAQGTFKLVFKNFSGQKIITISNLAGQEIAAYTAQPDSDEFIINSFAWKNGIYLVSVKSANKPPITRRVVITN